MNALFLSTPENQQQKVVSIQYYSKPEASFTDILKGKFTWNNLYPAYDVKYLVRIEVYFENFGWVPFDATFGELGKIDQGHIKLAQHHTVSNMFSTVWEFYPFFGDIEVENDYIP